MYRLAQMKHISLVSQEDLQPCSQAQFPTRPRAREKSLGTRLEDPIDTKTKRNSEKAYWPKFLLRFKLMAKT